MGTTAKLAQGDMGPAGAIDARSLADNLHDLAMPVVVVRAYCDRALHAPGLGPAARRELEELARAADDLAERATYLLTAAAARDRETGLRVEDLDFAELIRAVADPLQVVARERDVRLVVATPRALAIRADGRRLRCIGANLIANSLRHAHGIVRVELRRSSHRARLEVADDGPGIPDEVGATLFARYGRGGRAPGAGLGLALVREHVDLHGGTVNVGRAPEGGALVVVELPV